MAGKRKLWYRDLPSGYRAVADQPIVLGEHRTYVLYLERPGHRKRARLYATTLDGGGVPEETVFSEHLAIPGVGEAIERAKKVFEADAILSS